MKNTMTMTMKRKRKTTLIIKIMLQCFFSYIALMLVLS